MSRVKERLLGAITVMDEESAARLWDYVLEMSNHDWDSIEEVEPDETDLRMLEMIQDDPDCRSFE